VDRHLSPCLVGPRGRELQADQADG
jgi:hypothetical protein